MYPHVSTHCTDRPGKAMQSEFRDLSRAGADPAKLPDPMPKAKPDPKPSKSDPKPKTEVKPKKDKDHLSQVRTKSKNMTDWIHDSIQLQHQLADSKAAPTFVDAQKAELTKWHDTFLKLQSDATTLAMKKTGDDNVEKEARAVHV